METLLYLWILGLLAWLLRLEPLGLPGPLALVAHAALSREPSWSQSRVLALATGAKALCNTLHRPALIQ